jgi:hypothetical protein
MVCSDTQYVMHIHVLDPCFKAADNCIYKDESIAVTREEAKEVSDRSGYDKLRGHYTLG